MTAILTGEKARISPQANAAIVFMTASRQSLEAMKKTITSETITYLDKVRKELGEAEFAKMWKQSLNFLPSAKSYKKQIFRVVVRGEEASVIAKEDGGNSWQRLRKQNGVWKVETAP